MTTWSLLYRYRGQSDYSCSKETLFDYVDPLPSPAPRLRWDKGLKNVEVIRRIDEVGCSPSEKERVEKREMYRKNKGQKEE